MSFIGVTSEDNDCMIVIGKKKFIINKKGTEEEKYFFRANRKSINTGVGIVLHIYELGKYIISVESEMSKTFVKKGIRLAKETHLEVLDTI